MDYKMLLAERSSGELILITFVVGLTGLYLRSLWIKYRNNPKGLPFLPGPPGRFLVGNLKDIPKKGYEWLAYEKLAQIYGAHPSICFWFLHILIKVSVCR